MCSEVGRKGRKRGEKWNGAETLMSGRKRNFTPATIVESAGRRGYNGPFSFRLKGVVGGDFQSLLR